ncbi:octaprenyl-diphosphate synthase [Campylobacter mucosalis]|uniref:polyprenyl synthetase family protein n=1 Tax=Campylobacter mucosalis TaxID=202 RepID=UPI0004D7BC89|nr:polyprenyl synthetase family protein [Campylobacter mucosalis]KEA46670.1 octaprenyl-diphosphate synthase [Campylobacter mucosalis]QKF62806.1 octaprenyl-diphosphate synthase [Campylobacter mucosalis]
MQQIDNLMTNFIRELGYDYANEMFLKVSSGKKLRSKLLLKIAPNTDEAFRLCAVIELIHLASLLHDDVIDDANLRRGKPSINALFGTKDAIMLGDILYSKGFFELCKFDKSISLEISNAVSKLSIGELMDVKLSCDFNADISKYLKMIEYKTAVLIEASAVCGAILAGFNADKFRIYGKNLGLAFQIIDDVLDITQDEKTLGKPNLNDFKEGKVTLPYLYLYQNLDKNGADRLKNLYKKELDSQEKEWIKNSMIEHKSIQKSVTMAKNLAQEAIEAISEYKNDGLEEIIKSMIDREF